MCTWSVVAIAERDPTLRSPSVSRSSSMSMLMSPPTRLSVAFGPSTVGHAVGTSSSWPRCDRAALLEGRVRDGEILTSTVQLFPAIPAELDTVALRACVTKHGLGAERTWQLEIMLHKLRSACPQSELMPLHGPLSGRREGDEWDALPAGQRVCVHMPA